MGYKGNFSLAIAMQFSENIALPSRGKIATWLHGVPAKFTNRKIARIFRVFNFSKISRSCSIAIAKHATHRHFDVRR